MDSRSREEVWMYLFEDGKEILTNFEFQKFHSLVTDITYVSCIDSYLVNTSEVIYRKDIDKGEAYFFLAFHPPQNKFGDTFRYSLLNQRVIIIRDFDRISVVDLQRKEIEFEVLKSLGNDLSIFRVFGNQEEKVAAVTNDCHIVIYSLDYTKKTGSVTTSFKIQQVSEDLEGQSELANALSICNNHEYFFINLERIDYQSS